MTRWAQRDASWTNYPNVNHPARFHAIRETTGGPECGTQVLLNDDEAVSDEHVLASRKCVRCVAVLTKKGR